MNLLNEANDSKFVARIWNIVNDNSNANYDVGNEIIYNTEVLKSNLCDYYDAYILVRGCITVTAALATKVAFKSCALFTEFISKIDGKTKDLDLVKSMCNLIEYNSNYSETTGNYGFIQNAKQLILMQILLMILILKL